MALEMKGGDLLIVGATLTFVLACIVGMFVSFDDSLSVSGIGADLQQVKDDSKEKTEKTEESLQTLVTSDTGFKVKENIYIDERGDAESSLISEESKSSTTGFIKNVKKNKFMGYLDVSIWLYIISIIIIIGTVIGLRMVLGNSRV